MAEVEARARPRRVFVEELEPGERLLGRDEAHRVHDVLRLRAGEDLLLFNGGGEEARARVVDCSRREVRVEVGALQRVPRHWRELRVATAVPKGERADWLVEKLTELGVDVIDFTVFADSARGEQVGESRQARWRRLSIAAAEQCGRAELPVIRVGVGLDELLESSARIRVVCHPDVARGPGPSRLSAELDAVVVVGPEAGLTREEFARLVSRGYTPFSIGSFVMRVETAAVVGAGMLLPT